MCAMAEEGVLVTAICTVGKQQQREEKSINQKVMGSEQARELYLKTASSGMFENNIVAVTW